TLPEFCKQSEGYIYACFAKTHLLYNFDTCYFSRVSAWGTSERPSSLREYHTLQKVCMAAQRVWKGTVRCIANQAIRVVSQLSSTAQHLPRRLQVSPVCQGGNLRKRAVEEVMGLSPRQHLFHSLVFGR